MPGWRVGCLWRCGHWLKAAEAELAGVSGRSP